MKCFKIFSLALASALLFTACGENNTLPEETKPENGAYTGTVSVAPGTPMEFTLENAKVEITIAEDGNTANIKMLQVKFAEAMPMSLDITLPDLTLTRVAEDAYSIAADEIIPIAGGGPNDRYKITNFEGRLVLEQPMYSSKVQSLSLSFVCMNLPVSYLGTPSN